MRFMQTESVLQTKNRSEPAKNRFSVALLQCSPSFTFPSMQLLLSKINFEISYWLYLSGCLSSTGYLSFF